MRLLQLAAAGFVSSLLTAQVPIDANRLFQLDAQVGWVYGTAREVGDPFYTEHWVLSPEFVKPSLQSQAKLQVVPQSPSEFKDEQDFLARVPFSKGSKYIRATVQEFNYLPAVQR